MSLFSLCPLGQTLGRRGPRSLGQSPAELEEAPMNVPDTGAAGRRPRRGGAARRPRDRRARADRDRPGARPAVRPGALPGPPGRGDRGGDGGRRRRRDGGDDRGVGPPGGTGRPVGRRPGGLGAHPRDRRPARRRRATWSWRWAGSTTSPSPGPSWRLRPDSPAVEQARLAAVRDAVHRARQYAAAFGAELTALLEISDAGLSGGGFRVAEAMGAMAAFGDSELSLDLTPARQEVHGSVEVRFTMSGTRPGGLPSDEVSRGRRPRHVERAGPARAEAASARRRRPRPRGRRRRRWPRSGRPRRRRADPGAGRRWGRRRGAALGGLAGLGQGEQADNSAARAGLRRQPATPTRRSTAPWWPTSTRSRTYWTGGARRPLRADRHRLLRGPGADQLRRRLQRLRALLLPRRLSSSTSTSASSTSCSRSSAPRAGSS